MLLWNYHDVGYIKTQQIIKMEMVQNQYNKVKNNCKKLEVSIHIGNKKYPMIVI